jgi:hypothetical protein
MSYLHWISAKLSTKYEVRFLELAFHLVYTVGWKFENNLWASR